MAKVHYNAQEVTDGMSISQILSRRAACGTRTTDRAHVYMISDWDKVDCAKCLAKRETVERIAAHRAEIARINAQR